MSRTLLYDADVDRSPLTERTVAVLGYGSQGRAQALCLRDSGVEVVVGLREGPSRSRAEADGWAPLPIAEAARRASVVALLVPDSAQKAVFEESVKTNLGAGDALIFAHGFNLLYGQVSAPPETDMVLVAPMGAGPAMRTLYEEGGGVSALVAVHQDATDGARGLGLAYAAALGCGRTGIMEGTVREEVETDLFGEQAVLCGGLTALAKAAFDALVEAGYSEELAYFECVHQIKLLADLIHERGIAGMREQISDTALYGDLTRGPRVIGEEARQAMREILAEIRDGRFAREWLAEQAAGCPTVHREIAAQTDLPIERVSARIRGARGPTP
jgi:ketol-acid reductoisomerase